MGNLMAYEVHMQERREEEKPSKKNIAFPAMSENESDGDEDMTLFVRRLNSFMKRGRFQNKTNVRPDSKDEIICYNCSKPGHMKYDCPLLKKKSFNNDKERKSFKKKALHVTWDDSDSASNDEECQNEVSNMCFMAHETEVYDFYELTREELEENIQYIFDSSLKLHVKNKALKSENKVLKTEISVLKQKNMILSNDLSELRIEDNDLLSKNTCLLAEISISNDKTKSMLSEIHDLKCKTNDLMKIVLKFSNGKKNLDMLLASQRISF
jgi:FtsZ-binding cell division protein ZapB